MTPSPHDHDDSDSDDGSAVAELVMVMGLLVLVFAGLVQVGLVMHVRNVLAAAAAEGARYAAVSGHDEQAGVERIDELARAALSDGVVAEIPCQVITDERDGQLIRVARCDGRMPLLFAPFGSVPIHVQAIALKEPE